MLSRMIHLDELPRRRVVVRFDVPAHPPPNRYWLVLGAGEREVCVHDPGFGDDAVVTHRRHDARRLALRPTVARSGAARGYAGRRDPGGRADARRLGTAEPVRRGHPCASVSSARMLDALLDHQHQQRAHRLLVEPDGRERVAQRHVPARARRGSPAACRTGPPRHPAPPCVGTSSSTGRSQATTQVRFRTGRPSSSSMPCTAQTTPPWANVSAPSSSTVTSW